MPSALGRSIVVPACVAVLCSLFASTARAGQAGPPYQTDDPDPVPLHHFEAYVFELSDRTTDGTSLAAPGFEMNWGAAPNLQLHIVVPLATALAPGESAQHGIGDVELGPNIGSSARRHTSRKSGSSRSWSCRQETQPADSARGRRGTACLSG